MRILFVHSNFPAQFTHLAPALAARGHQVAAIGSHTARAAGPVQPSTYRLKRGTTPNILPQAVRYEADCIRGLAAAQVAQGLHERGFAPDFIFGHVGWGETQFLHDIWPAATQALYAEYFVQPRGYDSNFDPEFVTPDFARRAIAIAKNASQAMCMTFAQRALAPTQFQRDCYPALLREKIEVAHDGIDTGAAQPRPEARVTLPNGRVIAPGDEIVTHVNRSLEPLRGLHKFLRALPAVFAARPAAQAVIIGDSLGRSGYGLPPPRGKTWKDIFLEELGGGLDLSRVHFLGRVPRAVYLDVLACSAAHVYLTYPFVLSWSLLEAMSAQCLVIGSDTAPVREMMTDGRNGVLVDFFDHAALAEAVITALAKPAAFRALRTQARADIIAGYDLGPCLARQIAFVERLA
ncbi:MAG: glycosyltransferase [Hyphomonadaceae bacterium]